MHMDMTERNDAIRAMTIDYMSRRGFKSHRYLSKYEDVTASQIENQLIIQLVQSQSEVLRHMID